MDERRRSPSGALITEDVHITGAGYPLPVSRREHGFHADYRERYNAEAAVDGWARCLARFRQHGVG